MNVMNNIDVNGILGQLLNGAGKDVVWHQTMTNVRFDVTDQLLGEARTALFNHALISKKTIIESKVTLKVKTLEELEAKLNGKAMLMYRQIFDVNYHRLFYIWDFGALYFHFDGRDSTTGMQFDIIANDQKEFNSMCKLLTGEK